MKVQRLISSDIISSVPDEIIESILTRMPIRDALRTSILSRRWRYCWMSMPKVTFDDKTLFAVSIKDKYMNMYKLVNAVFHVLLLHKGPILEFNLHVSNLKLDSELDQIILHLSRSNHVKKLVFDILSNDHWKLPSSFFTMQGLECLKITDCVFEPPLTFKGFNTLSAVCFIDVEISAKALQRFLSNCPLLAEVSLLKSEKEFEGGNETTLVDLLVCLPMIASFQICDYYMKYFCADGMPQKLPTSLVRLKRLHLGLCIAEQFMFSSALCIIRSSPNLELISFLIYDDEKFHHRQTSIINLHDLQNDSSLSFDLLKEFRIARFCNSPIEIEFVKLILVKSPVLKKLTIEFSSKVSVDEEVTMLRDLLHTPLPRASPSAKFIVKRS